MLRLSTSSDTESWRQVQNGEWFPISVGCRCHGRVHGEAMEAGRTKWSKVEPSFRKIGDCGIHWQDLQSGAP